MQYIPSPIVEQLVTPAFAIECVEEAYALFGHERDVLARPSAAVTLVRSQPPRVFTFKGGTLLAKGMTGHQFGAQFGALYFHVYQNDTGELRGILEHSWLNKRRTGATAAAAARYLAAPGARTAALIGAGGIAEHALICLDHALPLDEIRVAARSRTSAETLVRNKQETTRCKLVASDDPRSAVEGADIVITITVATSPVVEPGWLKPGAVVCAMGGAPELHFGLLKEADRLIVDDIDYAFLRGSLANWIAEGHISAADLRARVSADIGEVAAGMRLGRTTPLQTIIGIIQGMAICDLVIADRVLTEAQRLGLGHSIPVRPQPGMMTLDQIAQRSPDIVKRLADRRPALASKG